MIKNKQCLVLLFLALLISGCGNSLPDKTNEAGPTEPSFIIVGELPSSPVAQGWIQEAVADLAANKEVPQAEIEYVQFDLLVWPDASYGCAKDDVVYEQLPKEGYKIHLRLNGRLYFYHGGEEIEQFLCEA